MTFEQKSAPRQGRLPALRDRASALRVLAERLGGHAAERPLRVGIDGRTASGKTTLANELAEELRHARRPVIPARIDDFHRPKAERYRQGRFSAVGYYEDARDLTALVALLLAPLGPGGDRRIRTASFDLESDEPVYQEARYVPPGSILLLDGTFLQRPEIAPHLDFVIFVDADQAVCRERGVARDAAKAADSEAISSAYVHRYEPAFTLYQQLVDPRERADAVFDNNVPSAPRLTFRKGTRE